MESGKVPRTTLVRVDGAKDIISIKKEKRERGGENIQNHSVTTMTGLSAVSPDGGSGGYCKVESGEGGRVFSYWHAIRGELEKQGTII